MFAFASLAAPRQNLAGMQYFFASGNEQRGPYSLEELASFGLRPDTLVWREGMADWQRADSLDELTALIPRAQQATATSLDQQAAVGTTRSLQYESSTHALPASGMSIASLVLGIVSVPMTCTYGLGIPCAILGLIFGIIARGKARRQEAGGAGLALAGIICSCISLGLVLVFVAIVVSMAVAAAMG